MSKIYQLPMAGPIAELKPIDIPRKPMGTSTAAHIPPSVNDSIIRMFHDCGLSVTKIASVYRRVRMTEQYVEDQLRAHHRATLARAQVSAHIWRMAA